MEIESVENLLVPQVGDVFFNDFETVQVIEVGPLARRPGCFVGEVRSDRELRLRVLLVSFPDPTGLPGSEFILLHSDVLTCYTLSIDPAEFWRRVVEHHKLNSPATDNQLEPWLPEFSPR